jgi:hypothetical protein
MFGKILTEENKNLIKIIYEYGGYIRVSHLDYLYPNLLHDSKLKKLEKLKGMRLLTSRRFKSNSKREPVTYQVTKASCRLFDNPDSYFRKKHQPEYAYRALVKNCFCLENYKLQDAIITNHDERLNLLIDNQFSKELFPRKYNKESSFEHIEELIINLTDKKGYKIINDDELIFDDNVDRLVLVYIDKYFVAVNKQISTLINRYIDMILRGGNCYVDFLIVVDNDNRKKLYDNAISKFLVKNVYKDRISDITTKINMQYLESYYDSINKNDDYNIISAEYEKGIFKKNIIQRISNICIDSISDYHKAIIEGVNLKGSSYILDRVKEIIKQKGSLVDAKADIDRFFNDVYLLEFNNYISLNEGIRKKKFDIKTYLVSKKIYE